MRKLLLISFLFAVSCVDIEVEENPLLFFWEEMDKKYVFFEEKNVDWDSIKSEISVYNPANKKELVRGFENMIYPLNDGHVSVLTGEAVICKRIEYYNNVNIDLKRYLAGRVIEDDVVTIAQLDNSIVYVEIKTFEKFVPDFRETLNEFKYQNGIILDIRNNGGGLLSSALDMAANFIEGKHTVLYKRNKNGYGHDDFTDYKPVALKGINAFPETETVILIDNYTFSAANIFTSVMKNFSNAILIGNNTRGGGAALSTGVLPNGWTYSFSQNPYYNINYRSLELGVEPHHHVLFGEAEYLRFGETGIHSQMEFAYKFLLKK